MASTFAIPEFSYTFVKKTCAFTEKSQYKSYCTNPNVKATEKGIER